MNAQHLEERRSIVEKSSATELEQLRARFQQQADAKAARVDAWLAADPTRERTKTVNHQVQTVIDIDEKGNPVYQSTRDGGLVSREDARNLASGQLIKVDSLYPGGSIGASITGTGMVAGVWEPDLPRATHELLAGKVSIQAGQTGATDNHATHVTGTMVGKSLVTRPSARGVAYDASAKNWNAASDLAEMTQFAADGFLISNHSYGDANTQTANLWKYGAYDAEAKSWDALTKAAPYYLPFIAIGNEQTSNGNAGKAGYDVVTGSSAAKNVIAVGAVNADKTMSDYSNWGPTDDGRVKPEIVAKGTGIDSAQATSDTAYSGSGADSSGTSYAAPAAAAAGLLLQQYYKSLHGTYMLSSTLKALMLGTAEDLGRPGPDHQFGWGLLNVENAANAIKKRSINGNASSSTVILNDANQHGAIIEEITANPVFPSQEVARRFKAQGGVPLVVNLAWTDDDGPEQTATDGVDPTSSRAVYDYDFMVREITVSQPDARPWVIPSMANRTQNATVATNWFQSNGGNFKQVVVLNPVAGGIYTIYIRKGEFSPATGRTLSLVATGVLESPFHVVTASAGSNGLLACSSGTVNQGATTSCTATPNIGYFTQSISGCNGTTTAAGVNGYTTGAVNAACTVSAVFASRVKTISFGTAPTLTVGGASGTVSATGGASGNAVTFTSLTPTICTVSGSSVTPVAAGTCTIAANQAGSHVTTAADQVTQNITVSAAPVRTYSGSSPTGTGTVGTVLSGGGSGCGFASTSFQSAASVGTAPPANLRFPHGVLNFTTNTACTPNGSVTLTLTYPSAVPTGAKFYKFGPATPGAASSWYEHPVTISGSTVVYTVTDNGQGDSNTAVGAITDPAGVAVLAAGGVAGVTGVPTLSEWALLLMASLMGMLGMRAARRR